MIIPCISLQLSARHPMLPPLTSFRSYRIINSRFARRAAEVMLRTLLASPLSATLTAKNRIGPSPETHRTCTRLLGKTATSTGLHVRSFADALVDRARPAKAATIIGRAKCDNLCWIPFIRSPFRTIDAKVGSYRNGIWSNSIIAMSPASSVGGSETGGT
jgi:hypothetical protein